MIGVATAKGVCLLEFLDEQENNNSVAKLAKQIKAAISSANNPHLGQAQIELQEYFSVQRKTFSVALDPIGTPFQKQVWNALLQIPFGETRSYHQQSVALGNPLSIRAVANANGKNNIAVIIPCHRVIGSNGKLTGYAGGIWRKKFLLQMESSKEEQLALNFDQNNIHHRAMINS